MPVRLRADMRSQDRTRGTGCSFNQPKENARHKGVSRQVNKIQRELINTGYMPYMGSLFVQKGGAFCQRKTEKDQNKNRINCKKQKSCKVIT